MTGMTGILESPFGYVMEVIEFDGPACSLRTGQICTIEATCAVSGGSAGYLPVKDIDPLLVTDGLLQGLSFDDLCAEGNQVKLEEEQQSWACQCSALKTLSPQDREIWAPQLKQLYTAASITQTR